MMTRERSALLCSVMLATVFVIIAFRPAADSAEQPLDRRFTDIVQPFLKNYCLDCHGADQPKAKLDLSKFASAATVARHEQTWEIVIERLQAEEMPPAKAKKQPRADERRAVLAWLKEFREQEGARH